MEALRDPKEDATALELVFLALTKMVSPTLTISDETFTLLVELLDLHKPHMVNGSVMVLTSMMKCNDQRVDKDLGLSIARAKTEVISVMDIKNVLTLLTMGPDYVEKMVASGLIEQMTEIMEDPDPDNNEFREFALIWQIVLANPANQQHAFSNGVVSFAVEVMGNKNLEVGDLPVEMTVLNTFLAFPASHKEFVDAGGVKLCLKIIAQFKDPDTFASLCNIASNSNDLLRVIASEPALSAQIAIVLKKGPNSCQEYCINLVSLIAGANIPLHPSIIPIVIPALISFLASNSNLSKVIQALIHLIDSNPDSAKLVTINGGIEAVTSLLTAVTGELRKQTIHLLLRIPEDVDKNLPPPGDFQALSTTDKETAVLWALCTGQEITDKMIQLLNDTRFTNTKYIPSLCMLALIDDTSWTSQLNLYSGLTSAMHRVVAQKKVTSEQQDALLLLGSLVMNPDNIEDVGKMGNGLKIFGESMSAQGTCLLNFIHCRAGFLSNEYPYQ